MCSKNTRSQGGGMFAVSYGSQSTRSYVGNPMIGKGKKNFDQILQILQKIGMLSESFFKDRFVILQTLKCGKA